MLRCAPMLAALIPVALAASPCDAPLRPFLRQVRIDLLDGRYAAVEAAAVAWRNRSECAGIALDPGQLAAPYLSAGIAAFVQHSDDAARIWFLAAAAVDPDGGFDPVLAGSVPKAAERAYYDARSLMNGAPRATVVFCSEGRLDGVAVTGGEQREVYAGEHLLGADGIAAWRTVSAATPTFVGRCGPGTGGLVAWLGRTAELLAATPLGLAVAARARDLLGSDRSLLPRADCSGFVSEVLRRAGVPLSGTVASMFETSARRRLVFTREHAPGPGDLAFFDNTHDRDHDGLIDDPLSHIAVVEGVAGDGTVTMIHLGGLTGISRIRMNLDRPLDTRVNSTLRIEPGPVGVLPPRLTSQTWYAFATVTSLVGAPP